MKMTKIWDKNPTAQDSYLDFKGTFTAQNKATIYLACDSIFSFTINGKLAGFGVCPNYPQKNVYYTFDITPFLRGEGKQNEIVITVWHQGVHSQTYIAQDAFLAFEIVDKTGVIYSSGDGIKCRKNEHFIGGRCKNISSQLGLGYAYNFTAEKSRYQKAKSYGEEEFLPIGVEPLILLPNRRGNVMQVQGGYLIDLKRETVGFLDIDIIAKSAQTIEVAYGEHLENGGVRAKIHDRDFSVELTLKAGRNKAMFPLRRIAGRYLEVKGENLTIRRLTIHPVEYPLALKEQNITDKKLKKIYDTGVYTLKCCMHEHYEDCPWREQAFYAMDSRNQMLCGYYAFKGTAYQRANLALMARGLRPDGLLSLCFPAGRDYPIPFFSLVNILQTAEYLAYTGDKSLIDETGAAVKKIFETFQSRVEENGLIADFEYPYWNFYEWTDGSDNASDLGRKQTDETAKKYDLILNCFYVVAAQKYDEIFGVTTDTTKTKAAIKKTFYNKEKGLFKLSTEGEGYSVLGNAVAILAGVGVKGLAEKVRKGEGMIGASLSMLTFVYDALLKTDEEKYKKYILKDIKEKYGKMIAAGATTFWETEKGWQDFDGAGSLCHGWSAIPVYYIAKYFCG